MGDDHVEPHALQLVDLTFVFLEIAFGGVRGKLEQQRLGILEAQVGRPVHSQLAQLADVHLEAHAHGDGRTRGQLVERIPHGIEIEVRVAAMRRAYDLGDAGLVRGMDHAHALAEAACPVVNTGKDMAMKVKHVDYPLRAPLF